MVSSNIDDRRRFPRARESLPVALTLSDGEREFQATVQTKDISLTGVFFASTFFIKPGTVLDLEFVMPNDGRTVRTRGVVVRQVHVAEEKPGAPIESGFAMRFVEYYADAKTVLASGFLTAELEEFLEDFLERRSSKPKSEAEALRDVLVAWEVGKMEVRGGELDILKDRIRVDSEGKIRRRM